MKKLILNFGISLILLLLISCNAFAYDTSKSSSLPRYLRVFSNDAIDIYTDTNDLIAMMQNYFAEDKKDIPLIKGQAFNLILLYVYKNKNDITNMQKTIKDGIKNNEFSIYPSNINDVDKIDSFFIQTTLNLISNTITLWTETGVNSKDPFLKTITNKSFKQEVYSMAEGNNDSEFSEIRKNILLFFDYLRK